LTLATKFSLPGTYGPGKGRLKALVNIDKVQGVQIIDWIVGKVG
jgi:hypothetical protein